MRLQVNFIFLPSQELIDAALMAGEAAMTEPSVWTTHASDRAGLEHSKDEIEAAFWTVFEANLFFEDENELKRLFRERCHELGSAGCWTVVQTMAGGMADELLDEAREAKSFLIGRGWL